MSPRQKMVSRIVAPVAAAACAVAVAVPASHAQTDSTHRTSSAAVQRVNGGSWGSRVAGTFGKSGTVTGHFTPLRSFVRNGHAVVQGDLHAVMTRSNGQVVGKPSKHNITLLIANKGAQPRARAQAACNVLHLVLGPLNLNLLGLAVHLNKVVLDITANSGSGNLLGNLLCAVAHLLDNSGLSLNQLLNLSSLLNRIIGILT
jgi:hypothetical protein